jgi:hypothetical protein
VAILIDSSLYSILEISVSYSKSLFKLDLLSELDPLSELTSFSIFSLVVISFIY